MPDVVSFVNRGLVPWEAITTMGISVKEVENPIGFFGTGLKYAIASLLRTGQQVTIWCGLERADFSVQVDLVRGKEFSFVCMAVDGGDPWRLGFTTLLGQTWEPWMVFRELYSNMLDEGGSMHWGRPEPAEGHTVITVRGTEFADAATRRDEIFLQSTPLFATSMTEIHPPGRSPTAVFYRGVKIHNLQNPGVFTYNILTKMELTEDRTLKWVYYADSWIMNTLSQCEDAGILEAALVGRNENLEAKNNYTPASVTDAWADIIMDLTERRGRANVAVWAVVAAESHLHRAARVKAAQLTAQEKAMLADTLGFLRSVGVDVTAPVVVTESLGRGVTGLAVRGTIYLSRIALVNGPDYLAGTILEEHLHLTHDFEDETRPFQDFLINFVIQLLRGRAAEVALAQKKEVTAPAVEQFPF